MPTQLVHHALDAPGAAELPMRNDGPSLRLQVLTAATIALLAAVAFWPALRSAMVLDDFFLTAIARLVGNPLVFLSHSHMPGGFFYRPLGMLLWWLSVGLFGSAPVPHYALNMVLHIGVAVALWHLLDGWTKSSVIACVGALAFAVHPIAIGTALGLSDRFDLLAALLGIVAIDSTFRHRANGSRASLMTAVACATLAPLAKEVGFAAYAAMVVILLWPAPTSRSRVALRRLAVALFAIAAVLLAWRSFVLGGALDPNLLDGKSIVGIVVEGSVHWIERLVIFVLDLPRLTAPSRGVVVVGCAAFVVWSAARVAGVREWRGNDVMLCASGIGVMLATAVLQAPTLRVMPLQGIIANGQMMATDTRMFYVSLIGLVMLCCGVAALALHGVAERRLSHGAVAVLAVLACASVWGLDAHRLAREYRQVSHEQAALVRAALDAIDPLPALPDRCQVYFLDVPAQSEPIFAITVDSAIKALSPRLSRVAACRFQTSFAPAYYILPRGALMDTPTSPMEPAIQDAATIPWLEFGGVEIAYLNLFPDIDARTLRNAYFFGFAGSAEGRSEFIDISDEVRAGRHPVTFRCARSPAQCKRGASQNVAPSVAP